jgi:hypothetical protein
MTGTGIGLGNLLGLTAVVAINLSLFCGVPQLLAVPAIGALLVLLDVVLTRLLIWRRPLRAFDYGFIATGFAATMATLPYNHDPQILQWLLGLYRDFAGNDAFRSYNLSLFHALEKASLGALILALALAGGVIASSLRRRSKRRADANHRLT